MNEESYEAKFPQITAFMEHWRSNQRELVDRVTSDRILKCSLEVLTERNGGSCPFSNIYKVSVGMTLERIIVLLLLLLLLLFSRVGGVTSVSCVMYVGLRKTDLHTVETLVSESCSFKDEFAV